MRGTDGNTMAKSRSIRISDIVVGERRREDYGNLKSLISSIDECGTIQPIVVDKQNKLICGGRRLKALIELGRESVDVWDAGDVPEKTLRRMELEENLHRKDLSAYEKSRDIVELSELVHKDNGKEGNGELLPSLGKKSRGRPKKATSERASSEKTGIAQQTTNRAKQHVSAAKKYPLFKGSDWSADKAIACRNLLDGLDESTRTVAVAIVSEPGVPAREGFEIVRNLSDMNSGQRAAVVSDYTSNDKKRKSRAVTTAAKRPPMPDARVIILDRVLEELNSAIKYAPTDEKTCTAIRSIRVQVTELRDQLKRSDSDEAKNAGWPRGGSQQRRPRS